jgi:hypothetical protein
MKECPRCLFDESIAEIGEHQCEYCDLHDQLESQANPKDLKNVIAAVKKAGKDKKYDCIMGISGGVDSSVLLYTAVRYWNLNPLVIHFDNHWNAPEAIHNMKQLILKLNVDSINFTVNKAEYDRLNDAFLSAGLPDADIPNDIAMTKLMYDTAYKNGIKYILNGHDFRTEGSTPKGWTYMDAKYIESVYNKYTGLKLMNYPLFTFKDQLFYAAIGIKNIRPFHYNFDRYTMEDEMKRLINWQDYGGKHCENVYTEFVGSFLLPEKFNIDKRIVYLAAQVRSGKLTKEQAKEKLAVKSEFDFSKLGDNGERMLRLVNMRLGSRDTYDKYNFKKYKYLMLLLVKLKVIPYTFYIKYCL